MRVVFAFALFVGLSWAVSDILSGHARDALFGLAIALVSGALLWRDLRDPEKTRKGGEMAKITFTFEPGEGIGPPGTYARIDTYRRAAWSVALDRAPRREDLDMNGIALSCTMFFMRISCTSMPISRASASMVISNA